MRGPTIRPPLVVAATLLMLACSGREPWQLEGAPKTPPDHQYRTGVEAGQDFWQWDCYEGQRVVIVKYTSACYAGAPKMHKGPCGKPLDFEVEFARNEHLDALPESSRWPGSDAGPPPPRASPSLSAAPSATSPAP